jgi:hypothetical protein
LLSTRHNSVLSFFAVAVVSIRMSKTIGKYQHQNVENHRKLSASECRKPSETISIRMSKTIGNCRLDQKDCLGEKDSSVIWKYTMK